MRYLVILLLLTLLVSCKKNSTDLYEFESMYPGPIDSLMDHTYANNVTAVGIASHKDSVTAVKKAHNESMRKLSKSLMYSLDAFFHILNNAGVIDSVSKGTNDFTGMFTGYVTTLFCSPGYVEYGPVLKSQQIEIDSLLFVYRNSDTAFDVYCLSVLPSAGFKEIVEAQIYCRPDSIKEKIYQSSEYKRWVQPVIHEKVE